MPIRHGDTEFDTWVQNVPDNRANANPFPRTRSVAAIGRRRGFTDPTRFSRAFRSAFNTSPGAYRQDATAAANSSAAPR
jgi:AraC-like DNA-binding protein